MKNKISEDLDNELSEFIIDEHSSDAYSFLELQKKIAKIRSSYETLKSIKMTDKKEFEIIIHQIQVSYPYIELEKLDYKEKKEASKLIFEQTIVHTFKTKEELNAFQEALEHYAMEDIEELTREQYEHLQKLSSEE